VPAPAPRAIDQRTVVWLAVAGWVAAVVLAIVLVVQTPRRRCARWCARHRRAGSQVPLLGGIVDDYARVSRGDLPGRARDLSAVRAAVSFPIEPLSAPDLRLLGAWTTDVRGEPAAVLAYRPARSSRRAVSRRRGRVLPSSRRANGGGRSPSADGGRRGTVPGRLARDVDRHGARRRRAVRVAADHLELGESALILLPTARASRFRVLSPLVAVALSSAFAAPAVARAQTPTILPPRRHRP
jgi:hypothetical protein